MTTLEKEVKELKARQDSARSGLLLGKILALVGLGGYTLSSAPLLLPIGILGMFVYFSPASTCAPARDTAGRR